GPRRSSPSDWEWLVSSSPSILHECSGMLNNLWRPAARGIGIAPCAAHPSHLTLFDFHASRMGDEGARGSTAFRAAALRGTPGRSPRVAPPTDRALGRPLQGSFNG